MIALNRRLLFGGLFFCLALNFVGILDYVRKGPLAFNALNSIDESVYLARPGYVAQGFSDLIILGPNNQVKGTGIFSYPLDYMLGLLSNCLGLSPLELGIAADIFCAFFGYLLFTLLFYEITGRMIHAEACALMFLCFDHGGGAFIFYYLHLLLAWLPLPAHVLSDLPPLLGGGLPIQRGLYTQFSYPLFAASLLYFLRGVATGSLKCALLAGITGGLLFHCYLFSWISVQAMFLPVLAWHFCDVVTRKKVGKVFSRFALVFLSSQAFVISPAFFKGSVLPQTLFRSPEIGEYFYFSPAIGLALVATVSGTFLLKPSGNALTMAIMLLGNLLGQLAIMNLQPILRLPLAPYRALGLYLQPIFLVFIVAVLLRESTSRIRSRFLRVAFPVVLIVLSAIEAVMMSAATVLSASPEEIERREAIAAIQRVSQKDDLIAALPVSSPFQDRVSKYFSLSQVPNLIWSITGRPVLHQEWILGLYESREDSLQRELLLGWLYTGKPQLVWPCIETPPGLPGDIFVLTWSYHKIHRSWQCKALQEVNRKFDLCAALNKHRVRYLLWQRNLAWQKPAWMKNHATISYSSSGGLYELLELSPGITDFVCGKPLE